MCCGSSNTSQKNNPITVKAAPVQQAKVVKMPAPVNSTPFVIPKAIKEQLIVNQQLARIPKKT